MPSVIGCAFWRPNAKGAFRVFRVHVEMRRSVCVPAVGEVVVFVAICMNENFFSEDDTFEIFVRKTIRLIIRTVERTKL